LWLFVVQKTSESTCHHAQKNWRRRDKRSGSFANCRYELKQAPFREKIMKFTFSRLAKMSSISPMYAPSPLVGAQTLQAESSNLSAGVSFQATTDIGGGQNATSIGSSDYLEWNISVATAGSYQLTSRSATWAAASFAIQVDGSTVATLSMPATYTGSGSKTQTWASFVSPTFNLTAGSHKLRVAFKSSGQNLNWVSLAAVAQGQSKVEIRMPVVDDFLYLSVNGLRTRVGHYGGQDPNTWYDITRLFRNGANAVRVQAANGGGVGQVDVEIRVNGGTPVRASCLASTGCAVVDGDMFYDQPITLPSLSLPVSGAVSVTSALPGKIYLNDEYTGLSTPATLNLPVGKQLIGVGVSNDTPGAYSGKFYQKEITVGAAAMTVDFPSSAVAVAATPVKIALLPVRRSYDAALNRTALLSNADVTKMEKVIAATRTKWLEPFSYGLSTWAVTTLPVVENWTAPIEHTCSVLEQPAYSSLLGQYDFILVFGSETDSAGRLYGGTGAYSTGDCVAIPNTGIEGPSDTPNGFVLHEFLHQYEGKQADYHRLYGGSEGLHGAEEHGYFPTYNNEAEWVAWYRTFIRGQVGETVSMKPGTATPAPLVAPNYYVGTFGSIKYGLKIPAPR
jgi:hypothetical protein